jgi:hypothetical protein
MPVPTWTMGNGVEEHPLGIPSVPWRVVGSVLFVVVQVVASVGYIVEVLLRLLRR